MGCISVRRIARRAAPLVLLPVLAALTGCSGSPHRDAVSGVARSFVAALEHKDGAAACGLLTDDTRRSAAGATNASCAHAVVSVDDKGLAVSAVQVWGDAAQVHVGDDVVFLREISGRWRVSAAGCTPQSAGPYDCDLGG